MSVDAFIPEAWSNELLIPLRKSLEFAQPGIINRDYEGDIADKGDTVRVQSVGPVTIGTYTKNTNMAAAEELEDAESILSITQAKYFNFQVDDVDARQGGGNIMTGAMAEAAYGLADTADQYVAGLYADAGSTVGTSGAPKTDLGTAGKPYEYLLNLGTKLSEANVPKAGRWVIVPPWFTEELLQDTKFVGSGALPADDRLLTGGIGRAAGFSVIESNNVSNDSTTWRVMAGTDRAITYAEQISKVVAYSPELRFADAVKGLHLYGAKVFRPEALAVGYFNRP